MFGVNVGDTTNNWVGRLTRLFGDQDTSQNTARKLARWLLADSGVTWLAWIMGNHDAWNEGIEILKGMNGSQIPMEDWQARFSIVFPNGKVCKTWVAHNFAGNSIWNSLHGAQRAAHTKAEAHIYACGHLHNWAIHQEESASRDFTYWLLRAKGYKAFDDHAEHLGHFPQQEGEAITAVIDPHAKSEAGFVQCFADMELAADFLTFLRNRK
jgi:UDP-2,3-diacylglucosamine pyrophosphatase LpxH